jgi:hypothetical protein
MDAAIYAAHLNSVLKLASRKGGVSRPQIICETGVTRGVAGGLITKAALTLDRKVGRTEFFIPTAETPAASPEPELVVAKQSKPAVRAVAVPESTDALAADEDEVAELDAQIMDTRTALREAAAKAGKALGAWATHQALVDALRERMTDLAVKRMNASS